MLGIGALQDAYNQRGIDAQRQLFEQQQASPWTQLNRYGGAVSGLGGLLGNAGTTTGTNTTEQQTPWTTYAGLGISALGMMSDRAEKTDIKKIADDERTGLPIYEYRYKSDVAEHGRGIPKVVGPMAQDIERLMPGSTERVGGKLIVKREALGILGL